MARQGLTVSLFHGVHDSCATFADDRSVLLHLEAERIFRRKHAALDASEMEELVLIGLRYLERTVDDLGELLVARLADPFAGGRRSIGGREFDAILTGHHANHIGSLWPELAAQEEALIVCADGGSEDGTTRLYAGCGRGNVYLLEDLDATPMNGRFYGTLTQLTIDEDFWKAHIHYAGKTMGLAALGRDNPALQAWLAEHWFALNHYHGGSTELAPVRTALGLGPTRENSWQEPMRQDLAYNGQRLWVQWFVDRLARYASRFRTIALTGGCALNVVLNSALAESGLFERVVVGPASPDSGQSLGAVLWQRPNLSCEGPFLGRGGNALDECPSRLVDDILAGRIVGWFDGRSEIGPRALGHRSLLALPNSVAVKHRINKLKGREAYRPVAPIIRARDLERFFETTTFSPYMSFAPRAREETRLIAPAIVHGDGTGRLQTVTRASHPAIHSLLDQLEAAGACPIVCNTSFNFGGEPIVDTADDARRSYSGSELDALYLDGDRQE